MHIKVEGSKHCARDFYLVTLIDYELKEAYVQKFCGNQLRSRKYLVKIAELYPAVNNISFSNYSENLGSISVNNDTSVEAMDDTGSEIPSLRRSERNSRPPDFLATDEIQRIPTT